MGIFYSILSPAIFGINNFIDKFLLEKHNISPVVITIYGGIAAFILGLVLLVFAFQVWRKPPRKAGRVSKKTHYGRDFGLGMLLMASNFTSLIMFVPASLDLQDASAETRLTGLILLIIATILAMWLPLLLVLISGKYGRKVLKSMSKFMTKHGQQVSGGLLGAIAIYVLFKGLSGL